MKEEILLEALGRVNTSYLEQCDAPAKQSGKKGKLLRRSLLAAALAALLALGVSAALNNPRISVKDLNEDNFQLRLELNPAAPDAPAEIDQYYLPELENSGLRLTHGTSALGDSACLIWEKETGTGEMRLIIRPLAGVTEDGVFTLINGIPASEMISGELSLAGRAITTFTHPNETGEGAWYYWTDDARHILLEMSFRGAFSREEREALLSSVHPVSVPEFQETLDFYGREFWLPESDSGEFAPGYCTVYHDGGELSLQMNWQYDADPDDLDPAHACGFTYYQDYRKLPYVVEERETRVIDGVTVEIGSANTNETLAEECWRFTMPDGAELEINFWSQRTAPLSEEQKLKIFQSLHLSALPEK